MQLHELALLGPEFRDGERFLNGTVVDWSEIDFETMQIVKQLRRTLDEPIHLIRGAHPNQPTAIDACCPALSLHQVFMALTRLQGCSWGVYSGGSFHLDTRPIQALPARWMAVKEAERYALHDAGLLELATSRKDGWIYLSFSHAHSFAGLSLVLDLAEKKRVGSEAGHYV